jgi:superfamily I DNA/RNA helicase
VWDSFPQERQINYVLDKHPLYDRAKEVVRWLEDLGYWCLCGWKGTGDSAKDMRCTLDDLVHSWHQFGLGEILGIDEDANHARVYMSRVLWNLRDPDQLVGDWLPTVSRALRLDALFERYQALYPDEVAEFWRLYDLVSLGGELAHLRLSKFANVTPAVQLTTLHSSKGTEFEAAIVTGLESIGRSANAKRLLYVGVTRAKRELCLLYTNRHPYGLGASTIPRCIQELRSELEKRDSLCFSHETWSR